MNASPTLSSCRLPVCMRRPVGLPKKRRYSRWNFVAILCTICDIRIQTLETFILIFHFRLVNYFRLFISITPLEMFVAESVGVYCIVIGSLLPTSVELKINMLYAVRKLYLLLPVWAAILAIWWVLHLLCFHYLVDLSYSGNVTKAFPSTHSSYKMAAIQCSKTFTTPHLQHKG